MDIKITNPNKVLFPKSKITKLDVIEYYINVSGMMLPFIEDRLLSVIRCHDNIEGERFFKKHPTNDRGAGKTYLDKGAEEYFYISTPEELVMQAQNGTIEFHTWGSKVKNLEVPDVMVFDLDPDESLSIDTLRDSVLKVKSILDELKLKSFLKTSGGKGYHIVVPFKGGAGWEEFYSISKGIAKAMEERYPKRFTTNIKKLDRKGKIFIDYLRNNRGSTCVAPYSIRAREGAPVSMPISWDELYNIKPNEVTILNYKKYLFGAWDDFYLGKDSYER